MSSLRPVAQPSAATFAQLLGSWRAGSGPAYRRLAEAIRRIADETSVSSLFD